MNNWKEKLDPPRMTRFIPQIWTDLILKQVIYENELYRKLRITHAYRSMLKTITKRLGL